MMKTIIMILLFGALALSGTRVSAAEAIDYQKTADRADWLWNAGMDNPLGCIAQCGDDYDISFLSPKDDRDTLTITVLLQGKTLYSWKGHRNSAFRILDDRLYYAKFHPSSSGGIIVAVDLNTGRELWTSELRALGSPDHSAYRTLLNLSFNGNGEVVRIYGNESMGRYIEFKRVDTGQTVGHKILPSESPNNKEQIDGDKPSN
jgi:outer membrane protein assembly factor BamB